MRRSITMTLVGERSIVICDEHYHLSAHVSQRPHVQPSLTFQCILPIAMAQSFSSSVAMYYVLWMT